MLALLYLCYSYADVGFNQPFYKHCCAGTRPKHRDAQPVMTTHESTLRLRACKVPQRPPQSTTCSSTTPSTSSLCFLFVRIRASEEDKRRRRSYGVRLSIFHCLLGADTSSTLRALKRLTQEMLRVMAFCTYPIVMVLWGTREI